MTAEQLRGLPLTEVVFEKWLDAFSSMPTAKLRCCGWDLESALAEAQDAGDAKDVDGFEQLLSACRREIDTRRDSYTGEFND